MAGVVLVWLACGVINYFIMKSKGYENNTCLLFGVLGVLTGLIGLIIALCKRDLNK